jgi:hypothetical protein
MAIATLALRRLRARRAAAVGTALAVATAVGLLLAVAILGAEARDDSARARVAELPSRARTVQVTSRVLPGSDPRIIPPGPAARRADPGPTVRAARRALAGLGLSRAVTVLVAGPVSPADERGTRVLTGAPARIVDGRAARPCRGRSCEVVALGPRPRIGARVRLGRVRARVVGRGEIASAVAPARAYTHGKVVLLDGAFAAVAGRTATITVVTTGVLWPVSGSELAPLAERMRRAEARAERADLRTDVTTPAATLLAIDARARTAQRRLLLVGAQAAALFLAFAALLGVARRPDVAALETQLRGLGAARRQRTAVRLIEIALPSVAGAVLAVILAVATGVALPGETFALVAALTAGAIAAQHVASRPPRRDRSGLELAAVVCLGVVAWQAVATGGLDSAQVAGDAGVPVLLLVPGLALFAGGVLVARALPWAFRGAERISRRRSVPVRLALLGLTRGGGLPAAATTFLAVSLGAALFALDYRATLDGQLDAQAAFAVGTSWRAPRTTAEQRGARYVLRAPAQVSAGGRLSSMREATLLAAAPGTLGPLPGWDPPPGLDRLRTGARVAGPELRADTVELRLRVKTTMLGSLVLELLAPGQRFERVQLGRLASGPWTLLRTRVRRRAGVQIVGLSLSSALPPQPSTLLLGPLEQRARGGDWTPVDDMRSWIVAEGRFGFEGEIRPTARGIRAELPEADVPMLRPPYPVSDAVPAIVSPPLARLAVEGRLTVLAHGREVPITVIGTSPLLPTVTRRPDRFVLADYDSVVAYVSTQRPGAAAPTELWFSGRAPPGTNSRAAATARARRDALATGAGTVLAVTAALACLLATTGLLLAAGSALRSERGELAGWQALGAGPSALARVVRLRVVALYLAGTVAAIAGAALALRLVVALVAVTAGGGTPLPPIALTIDWPATVALIAVTGAVAAIVAATVARATLRRAAR